LPSALATLGPVDFYDLGDARAAYKLAHEIARRDWGGTLCEQDLQELGQQGFIEIILKLRDSYDPERGFVNHAQRA